LWRAHRPLFGPAWGRGRSGGKGVIILQYPCDADTAISILSFAISILSFATKTEAGNIVLKQEWKAKIKKIRKERNKEVNK
jgi:hypothetical protein